MQSSWDPGPPMGPCRAPLAPLPSLLQQLRPLPQSGESIFGPSADRQGGQSAEEEDVAGSLGSLCVQEALPGPGPQFPHLHGDWGGVGTGSLAFCPSCGPVRRPGEELWPARAQHGVCRAAPGSPAGAAPACRHCCRPVPALRAAVCTRSGRVGVLLSTAEKPRQPLGCSPPADNPPVGGACVFTPVSESFIQSNPPGTRLETVRPGTSPGQGSGRGVHRRAGSQAGPPARR